jgi:hypothetical protein
VLNVNVSLVHCRYHPSIIGTHVTKELHFFDKQPARTQTPLYQKQYFGSFPGVDMSVDEPLAGRCSFPAQLGLSSSSRPALVRMEATAMYLAHPSAAGNIQRLVPQVRPHNSRSSEAVNMMMQLASRCGAKPNLFDYISAKRTGSSSSSAKQGIAAGLRCGLSKCSCAAAVDGLTCYAAH